jgi:hypothetical protein
MNFGGSVNGKKLTLLRPISPTQRRENRLQGKKSACAFWKAQIGSAKQHLQRDRSDNRG